MEKDFDLKKDPHYHMNNLRERVDQNTKRIYDDADEVKDRLVKTISDRNGYKRWQKDWNKNDF